MSDTEKLSFVKSNDDGSITVTLTDGREVVMKALSARKQLIADELSRPTSMAQTRALCSIVRIGDEDVRVANDNDLGGVCDKLKTGKDADRVTAAYAQHFFEDIRTLGND